jgi:hypothetical protein
VGVGRGDASSEGEHAETSDARRMQAARHITRIHLNRRVPRITPPLLSADWLPGSVHSVKRSGSDDRTEPWRPLQPMLRLAAEEKRDPDKMELGKRDGAALGTLTRRR